MTEGFHPAHLWALGAIVLGALGVVVLFRNPARGLNRAFFAFALAHGVTAILSSGVYLAYPDPTGAASLPWTRTYWYVCS